MYIPNLDKLKENNKVYNSKWMFPIRMENNKKIEWRANIVEAFRGFRRDIDEIGWRRLITEGRIAAEPENQELLEKWWDEGWKETPTIEAKDSSGTPIMRTRFGALGEQLEVIYPTIGRAAAAVGHTKEYLRRIIYGEVTSEKLPNGRLLPLREVLPVEPLREKPLWTIFDSNNTPIAQFTTSVQVEKYLNLHAGAVNYAHARHYNDLGEGHWVWYDRWGILPISPEDEVLPLNWRQQVEKDDEPILPRP